MSLPHTFFARHTGGGAGAGEAIFTKPGTYEFVIPDGVESISAVCVGGGGGGGNYMAGAGGGLGWKNNISVTPGSSITVVVGHGGSGSYYGNPDGSGNKGTDGGPSYVISTSTVRGGGGAGRLWGTNPIGGGYVGDGGGNGGGAFNGTVGTAGVGSYVGSGGGGAGGYSGNGGNGGANGGNGSNGSGGGGGGGGSSYDNVGYGYGYGGGGGGVGLYGAGSNGTGGTGGFNGNTEPFPGVEGGGGSGGGDGSDGFSDPASPNVALRGGGVYGGGAGNGYRGGAHGAVRIIWGDNRAFPSTDVNTDYDATTFFGDISSTTLSARFNGASWVTVENGGTGLLDDSQSSWEVTCWVRSGDYNVSSNDMGLIIDQYVASVSGRLLYGFQNRSLVVRVDGSTVNGLQTSSNIENHVWYHTCFNWDGTNHRLFLDGVLIGTTSAFPALYTGKNTQIGGGSDLADYELNGQILDLKITHGQPVHTSNFNVPTELSTVTTGTKLLCFQGSTESDIFTDQSSNNFTLTRSGGTTPNSSNERVNYSKVV